MLLPIVLFLLLLLLVAVLLKITWRRLPKTPDLDRCQTIYARLRGTLADQLTMVCTVRRLATHLNCARVVAIVDPASPLPDALVFGGVDWQVGGTIPWGVRTLRASSTIRTTVEDVYDLVTHHAELGLDGKGITVTGDWYTTTAHPIDLSLTPAMHDRCAPLLDRVRAAGPADVVGVHCTPGHAKTIARAMRAAETDTVFFVATEDPALDLRWLAPDHLILGSPEDPLVNWVVFTQCTRLLLSTPRSYAREAATLAGIPLS